MAFSRVNQHGVCSVIESVRAPIPQSVRCVAHVRLGRLADGWRYSIDVSSRTGGRSGPVRESDPGLPSREAAIAAGLDEAAIYFADVTKRRDSVASRSVRAEARSALRSIQEFRSKNFSGPFHMTTAVAEPKAKANGKPHAEAQRRGGKPTGSTNGQAGRVRSASSASPRELPSRSSGDSPINIHTIHPHPDNRRISPDDADVLSLAESLRTDGQLVPILVRVPPAHWDYSPGHVQLIDGERRLLAALRAGFTTIRAIVRTDCDDAEAKRLLAIANSQRKELNPIEKAQQIERLCSANEDGSKPLTREQAAEAVGLETGAAASNLVRLLELPKEWQQRVASGELAWTWAREMLIAVKLPPVLESLDKEWRDREDSGFANAFWSRKHLADAIADSIDADCRRLDQYSPVDVNDEQLREALGVVELELPTGKKGKTEKVLIATEAKAFDDLAVKQRQQTSKKEAAKAGEDPEPRKAAAPAEKHEPTAAEKRAAVKERADYLAERIAAWRDKLLRRELSRAIVCQDGDTGLRLVLAYLAVRNHSGPSLYELLPDASGQRVSDAIRTNFWACVADLKHEARATLLLKTMANKILHAEGPDWSHPVVPFDLIEACATDLRIDVAEAWQRLQEPGAEAGLLEEFFLLHQTDELKELAAELKVHLLPSLKTKDQIIKRLLGVPQGSNQRLPLPKSIKPLAIAGGKPSHKGAKSAKRRGLERD